MKGLLVVLALSATLLTEPSVVRSVHQVNHPELYADLMGYFRAYFKSIIEEAKVYMERSLVEIADMAEPSLSFRELNRNITTLRVEMDDVLGKPEATGVEAVLNLAKMLVCLKKTVDFPLQFSKQPDVTLLLHRNGLDEYYANVASHGGIFLDKFDAAIKFYLDNLSEDQKIRESEMIEWYNEYKESPGDSKRRIGKACQFITAFLPCPL